MMFPWSSLFCCDVVLQSSTPLKLCKRPFCILYITAEHTHLDLSKSTASEIIDANLIKKVSAGVPRLDILFFVVTGAVLYQLVRLTILYGVLEEDGAEVGQGGASVALQDKLYAFPHAVIVCIPNPLLALIILF